MIFVTIGSQEPFDRLIQLMDDLKPLLPDIPVVAQSSSRSRYQPKNIETLDFIPPDEFCRFIATADLVVSHAGMGTILNVLEMERPLIVFPRFGRLKETRDDHQVDTAKSFEQRGLVHVAYNSGDMLEKIRSFYSGRIKPAPPISPYASGQLMDSLRKFIC